MRVKSPTRLYIFQNLIGINLYGHVVILLVTKKVKLSYKDHKGTMVAWQCVGLRWSYFLYKLTELWVNSSLVVRDEMELVDKYMLWYQHELVVSLVLTHQSVSWPYEFEHLIFAQFIWLSGWCPWELYFMPRYFVIVNLGQIPQD